MASKKIKGITIQLGADTSALDKALKGINSTSVGLNKELKEVNRLLKFDPNSTTLLAQKQEILSSAIANTEKKVEALRQAQEEVNKLYQSGDIGADEYREFQRTLESAEQSLKSYMQQQEKLSKEQERFSESTKQLNTLLSATGKSLDEFQDVIGSKLTNAIKTGTANSDDLTVAINKIGRAAFGADADIGKMRDALNQIDTGDIDDVRRALSDLRSESNLTEDSLNGIGQGVASGNLMDAADQISQLGDKVIELGENAVATSNDLENAAAKVNAYFGDTGEAAQKNADIIKNIYESGIGDSLDSVSDAVITVKNNLGDLNNTDLSNIVQQAIKLDEMYGIDMNESMRGVNSLMQHFGLDATDAMDLLIAGTQNGLDKTNELGDNISEYAGKFSEAGYTAEEYFQLLNNGIDSGAYNLDKVNDAINEVTTRLGDGTIEKSIGLYSDKTQELFKAWQNGGASQKDVIDSIVSDIASCQNQQEALNMASTAFGTIAEDGGLKMVSSLTSVGSSYDDVSGKAKKMQDSTTTSAQEMEGSVRKLDDSLAPIGDDIKGILSPLLDFLSDLAEMFSELPGPVRTFIEVFMGIAALAAVIIPVISAISAMQLALTTVIGVGLLPIIGVIAAVAAAIAGIIVVIKNWGAITDWLSDKWQAFRDFFRDIWNKIRDTASTAGNSVKDTLHQIWDGVYGNVRDAFTKVWNFISSGFSSLRDTIGGIVGGVANAILTPIEKAVNGVIKGVNWILKAVGSDKRFDLWDPPRFAKGTGGIPKDTFGIVNDQKGPVYREMIVPPDGDPYIPEGRNVILPLKKGTKIMPARQTKSFLDDLPHFAGGIGDFFSGIWGAVKNFTGSVWDYITHPDKIVKIAIDKFTDLSGVAEPWLSVAKGAVNTVFDGVVGFIKGIFDTQSNVKYNPSAGVEQWRKLAARALKMTGQYSEANLERLLYQMQTESGGNPNAINNWDINAINGTPSKGLMQVIDPTFRAYALSGYDKNIYDPLSNMIAAIRYTVNRYGSLAAGWQGHGYESGIGDINLGDLFRVPMLDVKWFSKGGILTKPAAFSMGGGSIGVAGEGREAEAITPISKLKSYVKDAVIDVLGDKDINISVNLTQQIDKRKLAKELIPITVPLTDRYNMRKNREGGVLLNGIA